MKRKRKVKNNGIFYVAISLVAFLTITVGIIGIGKAQIENSELAELTNFANSVDGNIDAFKVGVSYLANKVGIEYGATPGPSRYAERFCDNGLCYEPNSKKLKVATTTPCALRSPNATSTLEYASANFVLASSSEATILTIAQAATAYATTTQIGGDVNIAAGAQTSIMASTSPITSTSGLIFAPEQWLVFGLQGGMASSTITTSPYPDIEGYCKARFIITD